MSLKTNEYQIMNTSQYILRSDLIRSLDRFRLDAQIQMTNGNTVLALCPRLHFGESALIMNMPGIYFAQMLVAEQCPEKKG